MSSADRRETIGAPVYQLHAWPRQYGLAVVAVIAAGLARYGLDVALGFTQPFILFYPIIMLIGLLGGFGPSLFATLLSAFIAEYFFMEPLNSFAGKSARDVVGLLLFAGMGMTTCWLGDLFRGRAKRLEEFERAVEGLEEMIVVVDRDYRFVIANRAFLNYRRIRREDLIGSPMEEVLSAGVFETTVKEKLDECFRGKTVQFELRCTYPTLGERDIWVSYFPIEGPGGVDRVANVLRDVTEQKKPEQSLKLFRTLIDQSNDAVEVVDPATLRFLDVNEKACKDLGYSREELLTKTVFDINPDLNESSRDKVAMRLRESGSVIQEGIHRRKDGSTFPVEISLRWVELDRSYVVAVTRDITERKKADEALAASERRFRAVYERAPVGIALVDPGTGRFLEVNPKFCEILGRREEEVLTLDFAGVTHPEDVADNLSKNTELTEGRSTAFELEKRYVRPDGETVWANVSVAQMVREEEPCRANLVMAQDITKRKRAEAGLRQREEDYRRFVAQSSEGIFREDMSVPVPVDSPEEEVIARIRRDAYVAECNDALAKMYGFGAGEELIGRRLAEMLVPDDEGNLATMREFVRSGFRVLERPSREVDQHGNVKTFLNSMIGIVEGGTLVRTWGIQRDVTEQVKLEEARNQAEKALQASETHFRLLVELASDGIFIADAQGKYIDANSAGAEMLGYTREEMLQLSIPDIVAEEETMRIAPEVARFAAGATVLSEWKFRRKDGSVFPGEVCGKQLPDGRLQGILRDISERRAAEEAMRRNEERFRVALKDSPITVFNQDEELRYTWIYNPQLHWQHDALGKTDAEILGPWKAGSIM